MNRADAAQARDTNSYVVAGGSSGIGAALVALLADNARVYNLDCQPPASGGRGVFHQIDLTCYEAIERFATELAAESVQLRGVAVLAGRGYGDAFPEMSSATFSRQIEENLCVVFNTIRALCGRLGNPASVVAVSSIFAGGGQGSVGYAAAKAGVVGLVRKALAYELGGSGIRVNCVVPGAVTTPMLLGTTTGMQRQMLHKFAPLGTARPEQLAHAIEFLLGDGSSQMTGHAMVVDGGISVGYHPVF